MEKVCEAVLMEIDIEKFRKAMAEIDVEKARVDKVREAASSRFKELTQDQKKAAESLFEDMDKDKNGSISVEEFRTFLTRVGFETEDRDWVFSQLDKDNNGALDFEDLVTFFYVLSIDKYKPLLSRANTDAPDRKGQKFNTGVLSRWLDKLKDAYKLDERVDKDACSIL